MSRFQTTRKLAIRFGPVLAILLALIAFYALGLNTTVSTQGFAAHYETIMSWRADHPVLSALIFVGIYVGVVAISVPASLWLSVPGGLLFGWFIGGFLSWMASIVGATLAFLAARTALDPAKDSGDASHYARFKAGFERNAFSYIIVLRLMPLPFFVVNAAAGAFHVKVRTFAAASAIGLIPASFLFAALGESAGDILQAGGSLDMSFFQDPKIIAVFIGFASLSLLPFIIRYFRKNDNL
ncbi:MAG: VTT domain-containing protein [Robiginitomaculum sp.]|nr:VTT domain-containing protein [Robiginitomaculum sp.]MDQ7076812.1 VTT domain-containing protein [Robiginitomaculum sp.]